MSGYNPASLSQGFTTKRDLFRMFLKRHIADAPEREFTRLRKIRYRVSELDLLWNRYCRNWWEK
jgi:hypothetical protein